MLGFPWITVIQQESVLNYIKIGVQTWRSRNEIIVSTLQDNEIPQITVDATWANSTVLFTAAYNATSGTETEKFYAGCLAAGMWCYNNNNEDAESILGKIYNGYAAWLISMDIDKSNGKTNLPLKEDYDDLATFLGGIAVAGGKMKEEGLDHWLTPNTGATNESKFNALPITVRLESGAFSDNYKFSGHWAKSKTNNTDNYLAGPRYDQTTLDISTRNMARGYSIRMIKELSYGLVLGDSTSAAGLGQNSVASFILSASELSKGHRILSIADGGDTIEVQKAVYLSTTFKERFSYVTVQVGLNNLHIAETAPQIIARLQDLVDTIRNYSRFSTKIIASTMTPYRGRLEDLYGEPDATTFYQKWLDINEAIRGEGGNPIIDVDGRASSHTYAIGDIDGYLLPEYEIEGVEDHAHPNNAGREINAQSLRGVINSFHLI